MIIRNFLKAILLVTGILFSISAVAVESDNTPLEIALFPPLQLPSTGYGVTGLRLSLVGKNREVRGLDIALLGNMTDVAFRGVAISGLFNYNPGSSTITGLQVAGLANINSGTNSVYGVQLAVFNSAGTVHGLQLGLVNMAKELHGVQIGLVNMNSNGPFHVSPFINAAF